MPHSHPPAGDPPEITAFADHILKAKEPLLSITEAGREGNRVSCSFEGQARKAELVFTEDTGIWEKRVWKTAAADIDKGKVSAVLPAAAKVWYLNLSDNRGLTVSTMHKEIDD